MATPPPSQGTHAPDAEALERTIREDVWRLLELAVELRQSGATPELAGAAQVVCKVLRDQMAPALEAYHRDMLSKLVDAVATVYRLVDDQMDLKTEESLLVETLLALGFPVLAKQLAELTLERDEIRDLGGPIEAAKARGSSRCRTRDAGSRARRRPALPWAASRRSPKVSGRSPRAIKRLSAIGSSRAP
jgi:hypothetical protein